MSLVLSLFPGIGLLDMAFEEAGFCVVRGPDLLWGGDIRRFHPPAGRFDGVIGGPPCQAFSRLRHIVKANGYAIKPNLIPEFERVIDDAKPKWFIMENVPDAPPPVIAGYSVIRELVRDVWVGGETSRMRAFSFGSRMGDIARFRVETLALHNTQPELAALASGGYRDRPVRIGGSGKRKDRCALRNLGYVGQRDFAGHLKMQGLPDGFLDGSPLTVAGKIRAVGNGVPLAMGRAVAAAVTRAIAEAPMKEHVPA